MARAGGFGRSPQVKLRLALAALLLAGLVTIGVLLVPSYYDNYRLGQYLDATVGDPKSVALPDDLLRARAVDFASRHNIPLKLDQVRIERSGQRLRLQADYFVRVDLWLYTVDLHFHPAAGN